MQRSIYSLTSLGAFIKKRRQEIGITQKELGERLKTYDGKGRAESTITGYERGHSNVPKALLPDLAVALEISPITLFAAAGMLDDVPGARFMLLAERLDLSEEEVADGIELLEVRFKKRG